MEKRLCVEDYQAIRGLGVLPATMIDATIAPAAALQSTFGETLDEPLVMIIVLNWGALIALVGGILIYGALATRSLHG